MHAPRLHVAINSARRVAATQLRGPRLVVQPLCECWLMFGDPLLGELGGGGVAVRRRGSVLVVVDSLVFDDDFGLGQRVEDSAVEQLVA